MEATQVVIIGGGATGAGISWDLSLRGISAILLEQGDIANGSYRALPRSVALRRPLRCQGP